MHETAGAFEMRSHTDGRWRAFGQLRQFIEDSIRSSELRRGLLANYVMDSERTFENIPETEKSVFENGLLWLM